MAGFLLDTNVLSELVRPRPNLRVVGWIEAQRVADLYISAMTIGELLRGVHRLARGKRRQAYGRWVTDQLEAQFEGRILSFDKRAATIWGEIMGSADRRGSPRPAGDAQIAATARSHGLTLVTRNTRDFSGMAVKLLNPWTV